MEDTLRVYNFDATEDHRAVLILVLMEDTLRVDEKTGKEKKTPVLILVLMEDTLRDRMVTSL